MFLKFGTLILIICITQSFATNPRTNKAPKKNDKVAEHSKLQKHSEAAKHKTQKYSEAAKHKTQKYSEAAKHNVQKYSEAAQHNLQKYYEAAKHKLDSTSTSSKPTDTGGKHHHHHPHKPDINNDDTNQPCFTLSERCVNTIIHLKDFSDSWNSRHSLNLPLLYAVLPKTILQLYNDCKLTDFPINIIDGGSSEEKDNKSPTLPGRDWTSSNSNSIFSWLPLPFPDFPWDEWLDGLLKPKPCDKCQGNENVSDTPNTDNPITENPGTDNPGTDVPETDNPGTNNPGTDNPNTDNPGTDNPNTDNPATNNPSTDNPEIDNPETDNPGTNNPGTDNPNTDNPGTDNPNTDNPATNNPGTDNPETDNPGTDNPNTDNPSTEYPNTDNPATNNPGTDNPGTGIPSLPCIYLTPKCLHKLHEFRILLQSCRPPFNMERLMHFANGKASETMMELIRVCTNILSPLDNDTLPQLATASRIK